MELIESALNDAFLVALEKREDERGYFARSFCAHEFGAAGLETVFVQQNVSMTNQRGCLRGMHYQVGKSSEVKYIRCHAGRIFDVIIDLRKDSPTFCKWEGYELTASNGLGLYVPRGFAHGFQALTENCLVSYLVSSSYDGHKERGIKWNDPKFGISWPLQVTTTSPKDASHPFLGNGFGGLSMEFEEL